MTQHASQTSNPQGLSNQSPPIVIRSCPIRDSLSFSLHLSAQPHPLPPAPSVFIVLPFHPLHPLCPAFSSGRLSQWNALSTHLTSPFLSPRCNLSALSLTSDSDSHLPDCLWSMLSIHASSPAERDRWSHSSSKCSWAMNSPHKHWHKPEANAALQTSHKFSCKPAFNYFSTGRKKFRLT